MSSDLISSALKLTKVHAEVLGAVEKQAVVARLSQRLGVDVTRRAPWDNDAAPDGRLRPDGWELIPHYVGSATCLMFLEGAQTIWKFRNGTDLRQVLKDCPALEFYVCDHEARYLLCSNHHDFVIGWGAAMPWVQSLGSA